MEAHDGLLQTKGPAFRQTLNGLTKLIVADLSLKDDL